MKKLILLLLPVLVLSASCRFMGGKRIRGNGHVQTENRTESGFTGVESYGSFDVYVSIGSQNAVKIEADENLLPYIETYVENNMLKVKTKKGFWISNDRDIKIFVTAPTYGRIHTYGSGNIIGETKITGTERLDLGITGSADIKLEVDAPVVEGNIGGSGNLILAGTTKKFTSEINGSGDIKAMELQSEDTRVSIHGSGNANVSASVSLDVSIAGSGDVEYRGTATVNSHIAGSGSVRKIN